MRSPQRVAVAGWRTASMSMLRPDMIIALDDNDDDPFNYPRTSSDVAADDDIGWPVEAASEPNQSSHADGCSFASVIAVIVVRDDHGVGYDDEDAFFVPASQASELLILDEDEDV